MSKIKVDDEINLVFPKYNSGWPQFLGPITDEEISKFDGYSDYVYSNPEFSWEKTVAPTGISFVDTTWENYADSLFVGDCEGNLYRFQLSEDRESLVFQSSDLQDLVLNEFDKYDEITINMLIPAAIKVTLINIIRRSILSDKMPIGH